MHVKYSGTVARCPGFGYSDGHASLLCSGCYSVSAYGLLYSVSAATVPLPLSPQPPWSYYTTTCSSALISIGKEQSVLSGSERM